MKAIVVRFCFVILGLSVHVLVPDRAAQAQLPQELEGLSVSEFAAAAVEAKSDPDVAYDERAAIEERAAELLSGIDLSAAPASSYPMLYNLHRAAGGAVEPEVQNRIRETLTTRVDDWTDRPYDEIRGKVALMIRMKLHFKGYSEAQRWIAAGGTYNKIVESEQGKVDLENPYAPLAVKVLFGKAQKVFGDYSIVWQGRLTPTQSGAHTFFISPINVNAVHGEYHVQQSMSVAIGGATVISATPENWVSKSAPIQLTAGQPVSLRVETKVDAAAFQRGALHAILSWQRPGAAKSIVPSSVLSVPDADTRGLRASYVFKDGEQRRTVTQVDRNIDFAWPLGGLVVAGDSAKNALAGELADVLWNKMTGTDLLDQMEQSGELHPLLEAAESAAGNLTSQQRQSFLRTLLDRPGLLEPLPPGKFLWLYRSFRIGATDEALEVLGDWTAQRANHACELPDYVAQPGIDNEMRKACRQLAICVTQEVPEQQARLRDEHLELEDGTCSLPVAYTLGYSYQSVGRLGEWIGLLKSRLDDPAIAGDKRVNWLIARAHAEEIRQGATEPFSQPKERLLDGRGWLDEALLVVQSPATKARIGKEIAARLAAMEQFAAAREILQKTTAGVPAELAAEVVEWRKAIDGFEAAVAQYRQDQVAEGKKGYAEALARRRDAAVARGDKQAAERYRNLIEQATAPE